MPSNVVNILGRRTNGQPVAVRCDDVGRIEVVGGGAAAAVEVVQPNPDLLNANANMQVGDVDVANGNPVPVSDAGGSLTVDQATPDLLNANANMQVGDVDVGAANPVPGDVRFIDESGVAYGVKQIDNKPRVSAMPYLYDIAEGNIPDHEAIRRYGHNPSVGTAWETVYGVSNLRTYLTTAERLQIASTDPDDDGAPPGNGARTVTISGLDANYAEISETITLNGVGNVLTDAAFLRVLNMAVISAGATGYNEGTITASNNADTVVLEQIDIRENANLTACYTVPADHTAYLVQAMSTEASSKGSQFGFWVRVYGGLWTMKRTIVMLDSNIVLPILVPMKLPQRTDIEIRASAILAGANVTAGFEGWIEED